MCETPKSVLKKSFGEFPPEPVSGKDFNDIAITVIDSNNPLAIWHKLKVLFDFKEISSSFPDALQAQVEFEEAKLGFANIKLVFFKRARYPFPTIRDGFFTYKSILKSIAWLFTVFFSVFLVPIFILIVLAVNISKVAEILRKLFLSVKKLKMAKGYYGHVLPSYLNDTCIYMNSRTIGNGGGYSSMLSHEVFHILQNQSQFRSFYESNIQSISFENEDFEEKDRTPEVRKRMEYYTNTGEIEAFLHQTIAHYYKKTKILPMTIDELKGVVNDATLGRGVFDTKLKDRLNRYGEPLLCFENKSKKFDFLMCVLPDRYAMLIELYGDKELADQIREQFKIDLIKYQKNCE